MKKDNIHDFIDAWKVYDHEHRQDVDWNSRFKRASYYSASVSRSTITHSWNELHEWCNEYIGKQHYAWTGSTFWFENEKDTTLFILRWVHE